MAHNSLIADKIGYCCDCDDGILKPIIAGRCRRYHYAKNKKKEAAQRQMKRLPAMLEKHAEQEAWFAEKRKQIELYPYCWECGAFIPERFYRHATAHIFPKSTFPSIATNEHNFLILGAGCGCHNKSETVSEFAKMTIFPIAIERYLLFKDEIALNERRRIPFEFSQHDQIPG